MVHTQAGCDNDSNVSVADLYSFKMTGAESETSANDPPSLPLRAVTTRRPSILHHFHSYIVKHDRIALLSSCLACAIITTVKPSPAPITSEKGRLRTSKFDRKCLRRLARGTAISIRSPRR